MQPPPFGERRGHPAYTPEQRADGSPEHLFIFLPGEAGADAISGKPKMDPVRNGPGIPFRKLSGSLLLLSLMLFFFFNAEPACANLVFKIAAATQPAGWRAGFSCPAPLVLITLIAGYRMRRILVPARFGNVAETPVNEAPWSGRP